MVFPIPTPPRFRHGFSSPPRRAGGVAAAAWNGSGPLNPTRGFPPEKSQEIPWKNVGNLLDLHDFLGDF